MNIHEDLHDELQDIELMMNHGDITLALKLLEELSQNHPDDYYVTSLLGECYLSMGRPDKAIKPLKWAAKNYPQLSPRRKLKKDGKKQDEEDKFVRMLKGTFRENTPNNLWVDHYLLGCAYGRCLKFRSAIKHLNIADKMNPENAEVIRNLGWIRCLQEKKEAGRELLKKAIDLDPDNALAYNDLGASYMFEEEFTEAEKWIKKASVLDPDDEFIMSTAEKLEDLKAFETLFGRVQEG